MPKIEIHQTAIIGHALRPLQGMICSKENPMDPKVIIEGDLYIGPYSVVGEGVCLGKNVIILKRSITFLADIKRAVFKNVELL